MDLNNFHTGDTVLVRLTNINIKGILIKLSAVFFIINPKIKYSDNTHNGFMAFSNSSHNCSIKHCRYVLCEKINKKFVELNFLELKTLHEQQI